MNEKRYRHEIKYYINDQEYHLLRSRIRGVLKMDKHSLNDEGYHIRSLYFDDIYDSALMEKIAGVRKRDKYRVRIYNHSDETIHIERKSKIRDMVSKEKVRITRPEFDSMLKGDYEFLKDLKEEVALDFYVKATTKTMKPRIIVDYVREAYVYPFGDVRITFDKGLKAGVNSYDIFDPNLTTIEVIKPPKMILEVKYSHYLPLKIKALLQLETHTRSAISKYVICREHGMNYFQP